MVAERLAHVAKAPSFCPKVVVVELKREIVEGKVGKEGEGVRSTTNHCLTNHAWPPLNPYFHPPLHLAPIMHTPLTKSIKTKSIPFILFQSSFYLFILKFLDFILCIDEINKLWKRKNKK
jgi:hypothetical protein